jgi:phosphonate transport system substrate-binding protein
MKSLVSKLCLALLAALISFSSSALAAEKPDKIRIGLNPLEDSLEMTSQFRGIADHVSKQMGLPVVVWVSQSYNALIEALAAGKLEMAHVGAGGYAVSFLQGYKIEPFATNPAPINADDKEGRIYYKSLIAVRADSDIKTLNDLKGKTFAFVTPTSTSGGIGPRFLLQENGIIPERDFKTVIYAGNHDSSFLAIKNGKVDAGAFGDTFLPRWKERGMIKYSEYVEPKDLLTDGELRIIASIKLPLSPLIARSDLGKEFIKKLQAAFLSVPRDTVMNYKILGPIFEFEAVGPEYYQDVIEMKKIAAEIKKKLKKKSN